VSNGTQAIETLQAECDAAIGDIKAKSGAARCEAHDAVCRGLIVLLRCQRAQLGASVWWRQLAASSVVGASVAAAVSWLMRGALP